MIRRWQPGPVVSLALVALITTVRVTTFGAAGAGCQFTGVDRIVAVGDVHGAYDRFVEILRASGVIDAQLRWAGGRTHLVQLGDVVDRGPDSAKALDLLEQLEKGAERAGGAVHALLGNHEVMRMLGDLRYVSPGEYDAFVTSKSEDVRSAYLKRAEELKQPVAEPPRLGFVELQTSFGRNGHHGGRLRTLNAVVQIDGTVFVHGGISPAIADLRCEAINETIRREITGDIDKTRSNPLMSLAARPDGPLWYRGLAEEPDTFAPAVDDILARQHASAIVVAHTVTPDSRIRTRFDGKVVQIDTGMQPAYVSSGRASALAIERGVMTAIYTDRKDVLTAAVPVAAPSR
jgi:Calcineurin-like phosphoesterase